VSLDPGSPFPPLALSDEHGSRWRPGPEETLYVFFKTTCPTCELTWPYLERLRRRAEENGPAIVAVSQDPPEANADFARRLGTHVFTVYDSDPYPASDALDLQSVPTFFRVAASGRLLETQVGFDRSRMEAFAARADALAGRAATPFFTPDDSVPAIRPG
jgi:peroxiredoxin